MTGGDFSRPIRVFYSYSHKDEELRDRLEEHLALLRRKKEIVEWHDRKIGAGTEWKGDIDESLERAHVILLLISSSFLNSDYCYDIEMIRAMERHDAGEARVIPIILRPCQWMDAPFGKLQALPRDGKPVRNWRSIDDALNDVAEGIRKAIRELTPLQDRSDEATVGASADDSPGRPLTLPKPVADFVGRRRELDRLQQEVNNGTRNLIIRGSAGVGKTELALALAGTCDTEFPDARLAINLRGMSEDPLPWPEAMRRILRALQPGRGVPSDLELLASEYELQMGARSGILLLDNVRDAEQIARLIPSGSWLLLITSRQNFILPRSSVHDVGRLEHDEAREMLSTILSSTRQDFSPSDLDLVLEECRYLPFAIRLAGKALAERRDLSCAEYAQNLKLDKGSMLIDVLSSISLSHNLLDEETACKFLDLSIFSTSFDLDAAAAAWDVPDSKASELLGTLLKYGLVKWIDELKRYRLPGLVYDYTIAAREQAKTDDQRGGVDARFRLAEFLVLRLRTANNGYQEGGQRAIDASREFDANWPLIRSTYTWLEQMRHDERADRLINDIPDAAPQLFDLRRPPRERIRWREAALAASRKIGDLECEGNHLGNLGNAYYQLGEYQLALEMQEKRIQISRRLSDRKYEGRGLGNAGKALAKLGDRQGAIERQQLYLKIAREDHDRRGEGNALSNLALVTDDHDDAITLHKQAIAISREIGDHRATGAFLGNLGRTYADKGEIRLAIESLTEALTFHDTLGSLDEKATDARHLGRILEKMGDLEHAEELMSECVSLGQQLGHPEAADDAAFLAVLVSRSRGKSQEEVGKADVWVGREHALAHLVRTSSRLERGAGATIVVHGESGIGKTALANHFLEQHCPRPAIVLRGKYDERSSTPYRGFDGLVGALVQHLIQWSAEELQQVMPKDIASLCRIFPIFQKLNLEADLESTHAIEMRERRRRGHEALRQMLRQLASKHRLVLFVDDMQWAGRDTIELFRQVFRSPDAPACLTICALRSDDGENEFLCSLRDEQAQHETPLDWEELPLDRLSIKDAQSLAHCILGDLAEIKLVESVARQSEGRPLYVHWLADHVRGAGEKTVASLPTLEEAIMARVSTLSQDHREFLELLALIGTAIEAEVIADAAGLLDVESVCAELEKRRLIRVNDAGLVHMYHDKIRETISGRLSADQRSRYCRHLIEAAKVAERVQPATLAELYAGAGDQNMAGISYESAARTAHEQLAFEDASKYYRHAIDLRCQQGEIEVDLHRLLAEALSQGGRAAEAAKQYRLAASLSDGKEKFGLLNRQARCLLVSGNVDEGRLALEAVLRECGIRSPRNAWLAVPSILWNRTWLRIGARRIGIPKSDVPHAARQKLEAYWSAVSGFSVIEPLRAADFSARYLRQAIRYGDTTELIRALSAYSGHIAAIGYQKRDYVDELLSQIEDLAKQDRRPYSLATLAIARGVASHLQSRYRASVECCTEAVDILLDDNSRREDPRCCDAGWERNVAHSMEMWSRMYMGQLDVLGRLQPMRLRDAKEADDRFAMLNFGTQVMTHVALAEDNVERAQRGLNEDAAHRPQPGFFVQSQNLLLAEAFLAQYLGHGRQAWHYLQNAREEYRKSWLFKVQHMRIDFLQAEGRAALAAAIDGDRAFFLAAVRDAARDLQRLNTPWASAHSKLLRAALAATKGNPESVAMFRDAACQFQELDGLLFAAAARARAAQIGAASDNEALQQMRQCGVQNVPRMLDALIPNPSSGDE